MKLYNASEPQECEICGFKISHNKQGRFTSHINNEHGLTLEEYLLKYYYDTNYLKCSYGLCENSVGLRRGLPKTYCSKACAKRDKCKPMICNVCGNKFDTQTRPHRLTKTCSDRCEHILRSQKTTSWHQSMEIEQKENHFKNIITKTARTRKINNTPSWNSGKTGIYSEETIEKIRQATLKQMELQSFKKTNIEKIIENYLIENEIEYKYSFILEKRQYDFVLFKHKLLIECDGDYWHANPKFYPTPSDWQIERIKIDEQKNEIAEKNGYKIIRFWEDDIVNNFEYVKRVINDLLAKT